MNRYTYRRHKPGKSRQHGKSWQYEYLRIDATELPKTPAGYNLFTITKL